MKGMTFGFILAGSLILASTPLAFAGEEMDLGEREFVNNCAVCHGVSGKGDGPFVGMLQTPAADLTMLQKNNNGVFPFDRVYMTIDGRIEGKEVLAHGPRDMPIWGGIYNKKAGSYYADFYRDYDVEAFIKGRILALTSYIYSRSTTRIHEKLRIKHGVSGDTHAVTHR